MIAIMVGFASKVRSEVLKVLRVGSNATKVRRDGSQGQGRSEAEHAAPGYPTKRGRALKRAIYTRSVTIAVGPSGLKPSNFVPVAARFALATGYLISAPSALTLDF